MTMRDPASESRIGFTSNQFGERQKPTLESGCQKKKEEIGRGITRAKPERTSDESIENGHSA